MDSSVRKCLSDFSKKNIWGVWGAHLLDLNHAQILTGCQVDEKAGQSETGRDGELRC